MALKTQALSIVVAAFTLTAISTPVTDLHASSAVADAPPASEWDVGAATDMVTGFMRRETQG